MKKIVALVLLTTICFSMCACGGTNYPGNTKSKYWLSEDSSMIFYFPAEAGRGNAAGHYLTDAETIEDIILDWNAKTGVVEVMTAGYEKIFTANTITDSENLICTFEITSQEEGSKAALMPNQVDEDVKERRRAELYALQFRGNQG